MTDASPDWAELRRLAEAVIAKRKPQASGGVAVFLAVEKTYAEAIQPEHILALLARAEKAEAEAKALREALRPFGAYAARIDTGYDSRGYQDACPVALVPTADPEKAIVNLGHCRRARALTGGNDRG